MQDFDNFYQNNRALAAETFNCIFLSFGTIIFNFVGKLWQNSLIAYQFYRQSTEEDKLNDVPYQSEYESLRIINGLHYSVVIVHNGMF